MTSTPESPARSVAPEEPNGSYTAGIAVAGLFALVFFACTAWYARYLDWNAMRLAPAAAALHGERIYPEVNAGIVTGHIYGPLGALAFSPVTWLPDISTMMTTGAVLALAYFTLPFALLAYRARCEAGVRGADAWAVLLAVLLLAALDVRLRYAAVMIHAEAPAVGLAALAVVLAATAKAGGRGWFWAGVVAVGATLAKQTVAPTWIVLAVAAAMSAGPAGRRYLAGSCAAAVAAALWITVNESWPAVWYNCVWVPAHHPWNTPDFAFTLGAAPTVQPWSTRARVSAEAFLTLATTWWPAFAVAAWKLGSLARHRVVGAGGLQRVAVFAAAAAAAEFPLALASHVKVGGDVNSFDPLLVPLTLMLAAMALQALAPDRAAPRRGMVIATLLCLAACNVPRLIFLAEAISVRPDPSRPIVDFLRRHPGETYLPWNPLHEWVAEHRRDHFEYGVFDRALAGRAITPEHYRAHLPPRMHWLAIRRDQPPNGHEMYRHYLGAGREVPAPTGLSDWRFFELPPGAAEH